MAPRLPPVLGLILFAASCAPAPPAATERVGASSPARLAPPTDPRAAAFWNHATIYFLLIDRFANGDTANDHALGRAHDGALLRNFEGGDLRGVRDRIQAGYFDSLGVDAIWLSPFVEQIHGSVDEGTGKTYGYHGYWTRDWTAVDPAFGTAADLHALVDAAHRHHIRVLMDAVLNHTGPVTPEDPVWPADWVRTTPQCTYRGYATTVECTLVANLPDIRTESDAPVALPSALLDKWRREGRAREEQASLDSFFVRTGFPRAPRYYLIKWLTDWVRRFGFDGYRVDTAKHFEPGASDELKVEASAAYEVWRRHHPQQRLDGRIPFFMMGEVFGWAVEEGRQFDYGDRSVDFFSHGYDALINFAFKADARWPLDSLFGYYAGMLHGPLDGVAEVNYLSSHDDGQPYDPDRRDPYGAAIRLLLAPGAAQIYYGDELSRPLHVAGAQGDANLRSLMNWSDLAKGGETAAILRHWRLIGQFRHDHPSVGAGLNQTLQTQPPVFGRVLITKQDTDRVVIAVDQPVGAKTIPVSSVFPDGTALWDGYSGVSTTVTEGKVTFSSPATLVLLSAVSHEPSAVSHKPLAVSLEGWQLTEMVVRAALAPLTAHRSPLTAHRSPLTAYRSPLTAHRLPLTAHRLPLTAHF
ncbi:MAG TPA: alpha-amylase family glycosyl hydrolase [Gemmatimonadales bacterium]|nr:alpha-amylase family glycosyl hydrolase [Gemmatimonadales bacterium]